MVARGCYSRPPQALLLGHSSLLLTSGAGKARKREVKFWDVGASGGTLTGTPSLVHVEEFDSAPSLLYPLYDPDTGLLLLWARGETSIRTFDIGTRWRRVEESGVGTPKPFKIIACAPLKAGVAPNVAVVALPKRVVDVTKVEISKLLRLTSATLEPLSLYITRAGTRVGCPWSGSVLACACVRYLCRRDGQRCGVCCMRGPRWYPSSLMPVRIISMRLP